MIRDIMHDPEFLSKRGIKAGPDDLQTAQDLMETLSAHSEECVGMAANMIGVNKNIIVYSDEIGLNHIMMNPKIIAKSEEYKARERCLSRIGIKVATRYKKITVRYQDLKFTEHTENFSDFTAQIIQHEMDHLKGILI